MRTCGFTLTDKGSKSTVSTISDSDRAVDENIMRIWTSFAKSGNPSVKGLIEWPSYEPAANEYLLITDPLQIKTGFSDLSKIQPDTSKQTIF